MDRWTLKKWPDQDIRPLLKSLDTFVAKGPDILNGMDGARQLRKFLEVEGFLEKTGRDQETKWECNSLYSCFSNLLQKGRRIEFPCAGIMSLFTYGTVVLDLEKVFCNVESSYGLKPHFTLQEAAGLFNSAHKVKPDLQKVLFGHAKSRVENSIALGHKQSNQEDQREQDIRAQPTSFELSHGKEHTGSPNASESQASESVGNLVAGKSVLEPVPQANSRQAKRRRLDSTDDIEIKNKERRLSTNQVEGPSTSRESPSEIQGLLFW